MQRMLIPVWLRVYRYGKLTSYAEPLRIRNDGPANIVMAGILIKSDVDNPAMVFIEDMKTGLYPSLFISSCCKLQLQFTVAIRNIPCQDFREIESPASTRDFQKDCIGLRHCDDITVRPPLIEYFASPESIEGRRWPTRVPSSR